MNSAIIGTGLIAGYHAKALKDQGSSIVTAVVVGSSLQKAQQFAEHWGIPRAAADYSMALADDIDVVHICTPPALHYQMVRDALKAGKHVVCEKPFTFDPAESEKLVELAQSSNLVNAIGFNMRFHPACQEARSIIAGGEIGKVNFVHGSYLQEFHLLPCPYGWRYDSKLSGPMRAVTEIGSHWLDIAEYLTSAQVEAVAAQFGKFNPQRWRIGDIMRAEPSEGAQPLQIDSEDMAFLLIRFTNGIIGNVVLSEVTHGRINYCSVEVGGNQGTLWWNSEDEHRLNVGRQGQGVCTRVNPWADGFQDTFRDMVAAVYADVAVGYPSENPAYPTFEDGHRNVAICTAVYRSASEKSSWKEVR